MKRLPIGILGSGRGSNCRAILERIHSGELAAEARVVISDVLDAPILDIAREFSVANAYLPRGRCRSCGSCRFHARPARADAQGFPAAYHQYPSLTSAKIHRP